MTPPDNRPIFSGNVAIPFALGLPVNNAGSCAQGLCHESPKADPLSSRSFFPEWAIQNRLIAPSAFGASKAVIAQVNPFLRDEETKAPTVFSSSTPNTSLSARLPADQAKIFADKGKEFLDLAHKPGLSVEEQFNHLHTALFNFQMLGDSEKCKAILGEMQALYEKNGNEFGKSFTQAQLSFLQGDENGFSAAIQAYEKLDAALRAGLSGLPDENTDALRADVKNKLFIAYVSRAQLYSSQGRPQHATVDFEQALLLNPNKGVFQLYAQSAYQAGLFDFEDHDRQIEVLSFQRNILPREDGNQPCNSHHQEPLSDFKKRELDQKLHAHQLEVDAKISAIRLQSNRNLEKFQRMMGLAYPASNSAERYEKALMAAQFLEQFGRKGEAQQSYLNIMQEREGSQDPEEVLRYSTAANHMAGLALQDKNNCAAQDYAKKAIQILQAIPSTAETKFLISQSKFIQTEALLNAGNIESGRSILEDLKATTSTGEKGSLQDKLLGRIYVRLAQVYYSKKETFAFGDQLAEEVKTKFSGEAEIVGDTFFAKALSRVGIGKALEAVDILREEVQKPYPQSSSARAIASDPRFQRFLTTETDSQGQKHCLLKASSEINEQDWSEAFKVAVAKSGEGSTERKAEYGAAGGAGDLAGLAFAPEPVATKVAAALVGIGVGVGLLWERFVSASEHSEEIYDAYRTGLSNISSTQNTMNMLLLGADVAMLLTAGMAGSVAKAFVREGLAVTAEELTARYVMSAGVKIAGEDAAIWMGRGILFAAENTASGFVSYAAYQTQKSLFFRQEFHWDSSEALQWIAMSGMIEGASRIRFLGTAAAELPVFQRGPLKNIVVDGKVIGRTTSEGLAAKWLVDAGFGLSAYYTFARPQENYADFMAQNIFMMGVMHAGGAAARKLTGGVSEALISKIDKRANEAFARARDNMLKDPPLNGGFGFEPAFALADGGITTHIPTKSNGISGEGTGVFIPFQGMMRSRSSDPQVRQLEDQFFQKLATERKLPPDKTQNLRDEIKRQLAENMDWRRSCGGDFSFVDQYSSEQLQVLQSILNVDRVGSMTSGNTHLLFRMKETGFLDGQLMNMSPESLNAFSRLSGKSANGRDFAERVFNDYMESRPEYKSGLVSTGRESGVLFETLFDVDAQRSRSRLDLVMEAYFWMEAANVEGARDVIVGITGEYYDAHRVRDVNAPSGYRPKGWNEVNSPNEWRGNIDEAIRMGQLAREHAWRPYYPDALVKGDSYLGEVSFTTVGGGKAQDIFQPDGLNRSNWAEEYKSTYRNGNSVGDFSTIHMSNPDKFRNQVRKYGQAVQEGKVNGVIYRVTAQSITPEIIDFIKANIPNVKVIRYNSIMDSQGEVVFEQHLKAEEPVVTVSDAQKRAVQNNYPYIIEDGQMMTYRVPEKVEAAPGQVATLKDKLLIYTDTLDTRGMGPDLATRIRNRAAVHIEWLARVYERLPQERRALIDAKVDALTQELDQKLPRYRSEEAKAKLIYSSVEDLARSIIATELPVWEQVPLGLSGTRLEASKGEVRVNGPMDEIPGRLKIYLTDSQIRGPYQRLSLVNRFKLSKGDRIYMTDLSPQEASSAITEKFGKASDQSRGNVIGFEAQLDFGNEKQFKKKTDEQGRVYYEVMQDMNVEKGKFDITYYGQNPKVDYFQAVKTAN